MKKTISAAIIAILACTMIACDNTTTPTSRITKGDESKIDSLSYCVGFDNTLTFYLDMPDAKLDWNLVAETCIETLLTPIDGETLSKHEEALGITTTFFDVTRIERLNKIKLEKQGGDPNKQVDIKSELPKIDIFESAEEREHISREVGRELGYTFSKMPYHLQAYWFAKGIIDATQPDNISNKPYVEAYLNYYHEVVWPLTNAENSAKWLSKVSKELNVKQTKSGLLYRINDMGDENNIPTIHSTVTLNYESQCYDGRVYASTYLKNKPSVIQLERIIKGWAEGLQLVGNGGKITLWIPAHLAFGERGSRFVGPNEAVQFDIEVLDVKTPNVQYQSVDFGPAPAKQQTKQTNQTK